MRPVGQYSLPPSAASSAAPTPLPQAHDVEPIRPAAPGLGRSLSEPRSLAILALQGIESQAQSDAVTRGLRGNRLRSATVTRLAPLHSRAASADTLSYFTPLSAELERGRSPGPSAIGRSMSEGDFGEGSAGRRAPENTEVVHQTLGIGALGRVRAPRKKKGKRSGKGDTV